MEARQYLKEIKDDGWYLHDTEGATRQYVHRDRSGFLTVCFRHNDELGSATLASAREPAESDIEGTPEVVVETTSTGASAYCRDLPGVAATGPDEVSTRERMSEAVALHRGALNGEGPKV
ncbi:MAG: hypothetical protein R3314_03275 [Longimicrobiales bacterium]|nr:hypothetical protein [Longimicrobiales bacterium]